MFVTAAQYITLAVIIGAVSAELTAVLQALRHLGKYHSKWLFPVEFSRMFWHRFTWASPLFHEVYCKRMGGYPAYRVSRALYVYAVAQATLAVAYFLGDQTFGLRLTFDTSVVAAVTFFMTVYGKAFYAYRTRQLPAIRANIG